MIRRAGFVAATVAVAALCVVPGTAFADVVFDQADADELAATLEEAYQAQQVCYGWQIDVDNEGVPEQSVGSNFGAGQSVHDAPEAGSCQATVEFTATITWTSEYSEQEDSASYSVSSSAERPTTDDLDALEVVSTDGLIGELVDVDVYKAVSALPLLAADAGIADPIEAAPASQAAPADAQPTNSPGSDFWRTSGMQVLWGSLILLAGVVFAVYVIRSSRRPAFGRGGRGGRGGRPRLIRPQEEQIPEYVPPEWSKPAEPADPAETDEDSPEAGSPDEPPRPKS